jgi:hypothetical protein
MKRYKKPVSRPMFDQRKPGSFEVSSRAAKLELPEPQEKAVLPPAPGKLPSKKLWFEGPSKLKRKAEEADTGDELDAIMDELLLQEETEEAARKVNARLRPARGGLRRRDVRAGDRWLPFHDELPEHVALAPVEQDCPVVDPQGVSMRDHLQAEENFEAQRPVEINDWPTRERPDYFEEVVRRLEAKGLERWTAYWERERRRW